MNRRVTTTALSAGQQLDALCWAANEAGVSYGQFCSRLSAAERERVFDRYAKLLEEREAVKLRNEMLRKKRRRSGKGDRRESNL